MGAKRSPGLQLQINMNQKLGIIIVTYGNEADLPALLRCVVAEKQAGDHVVLIDNHPLHSCADIAENTPGVDIIIRSENIGFAAGCNRAARALPDTVGLILFLNPDVLPHKYAIRELRKGASETWGAWMGLLTMPDETINSAGNVVHMSGLSWCSSYGLPSAGVTARKQVEVLSGACLMIRKDIWSQLDGFAEDYFMYYEDTDLSIALRQRGMSLGIVPTALFRHDYIYDKGSLKRFYLERNRYVFICRQWPLGTILVLLPFLVTVEIGLWVVSIGQGKFLTRAKAVLSFLKISPRVWRSRQHIQKQHRTTNAQFLEYLQPRVSTPLLGKVGQSELLNKLFTMYYRAARFLVNTVSRRVL